MRALIIVLLVLTVIMLIPLGVDGGYNGRSFILSLRVGLINIRIFPQKLKEPKVKKLKKAKEKGEEVGEKIKPKKKLNKDEIFRLAKLGLRALGRFRRKLKINYIRLHYTFASDDPFSTAMGFGASSAAISVVVPLIDTAFVIEERDIGTSFDFLSDEPTIDCWINMTIQVWEVFYIAIAFGVDMLKLKIKSKRENRLRKE